MKRLDSLLPEFVDKIPDVITHGILYVCEKDNMSMHKCPCGCGVQIGTPIRSGFTNDNGKCTFTSLNGSNLFFGNFDCTRSHHPEYYITENKIQWLK
jgi:hypothetical protein